MIKKPDFRWNSAVFLQTIDISLVLETFLNRKQLYQTISCFNATISHPILFHSALPIHYAHIVRFYPIQSLPILSYPIKFQPVRHFPCSPIPSHPIPSHPILLTYFFIFHSVASLRSVAAEFLSWIDRYRLTSVLSTPCLYFQSTGNPSSLLTALVTWNTILVISAKSHHITSHHITSHHITSHHITSHHIMQ